MRRTLRAGLIGLAMMGGVQAGVAQDASLQALLDEGRYLEAYDRAVSEDPRPAGLARAARALLNASMLNGDVYVRWPALRAAQHLTDRALASGARKVIEREDRYEQSLALEILANTDPRGGRQVFIDALASPYRSVRLRALQALASAGDDRLSDHFAEILAHDPDPDLRAFAARALAGQRGGQAAAALYRALDDPVPIVEEEAVRALVRLGDPGVSEVLQRRLAEEASERRLRAIRFAGAVPDRALAFKLGPFLADPDADTRAFAAASILSILRQTDPPPE